MVGLRGTPEGGHIAMRGASPMPATAGAATRAAPAFDMRLVQRGARLRRSPFFDATQRHGARGYTVYNHMLFPIRFDDLEAEYWKLVNEVTLWDVGVRSEEH